MAAIHISVTTRWLPRDSNASILNIKKWVGFLYWTEQAPTLCQRYQLVVEAYIRDLKTKTSFEVSIMRYQPVVDAYIWDLKTKLDFEPLYYEKWLPRDSKA
ncbi:hypothetical protein VNO78_21699 [Psophocarpus tetragonolobus]|uniref:Uncharacterized protein n=1 Tax=Psophocarpus tetragonolobus TaxID=3891 RepID=A0AAN9XIB2_PSOTE